MKRTPIMEVVALMEDDEAATRAIAAVARLGFPPAVIGTLRRESNSTETGSSIPSHGEQATYASSGEGLIATGLAAETRPASDRPLMGATDAVVNATVDGPETLGVRLRAGLQAGQVLVTVQVSPGTLDQVAHAMAEEGANTVCSFVDGRWKSTATSPRQPPPAVAREVRPITDPLPG